MALKKLKYEITCVKETLALLQYNHSEIASRQKYIDNVTAVS